MKHTFDFTYYGLNCSTVSDNSLFHNLLQQKFLGFAQQDTFYFENTPVKIFFSSKTFSLPRNSLNKISNSAWKSSNTLYLKHFYLGSTTYIKTTFVGNTLNTIEIFFKSNYQFLVLNAASRNVLKRQLFQQLIKLYIEQSMLWYLTKVHSLQCIHASTVVKNGRALVFAGLNGVGKSTHAQKLVKEKRATLYSDNYLLTNTLYAYYSPDVVRLDKRSLQLLDKKAKSKFGFGKYTIDTKSTNLDVDLHTEIAAIFFTTLGQQDQHRHFSPEQLLSLQISSGEEVSQAPISQYDPTPPKLDNFPDCKYYHQVIKKRN